jgi:YD repeat-containing protein
MKVLLLAGSLILSLVLQAQYYYKDIIGTNETANLINAYKKANVSRVLVNSYDAEGVKSEDFFVEQSFSLKESVLKTTTRSGTMGESVLTSFADAAGRITKTIDSSDAVVSSTLYTYDAGGRLTSVITATTDTSKKINETEEHKWEYTDNNVTRMLRIKNKTDTTIIVFKLDNAGNVTEEQGTRKGIKSEPVYYYYDAANRLTDIVRFNNKAKRLLPEYMFEYSATNQVIQKITIPANSSAYTIWRYQYDAGGLKIREAVYDKYKQLTGKIEYLYQRG